MNASAFSPTAINLQKIGKRFNRQWIFRNLSYSFFSGNAYAITGYNGSGKSTLLQIIAGLMEKSEGEIEVLLDEKKVADENRFQLLSFSAPYMDLIEEFTLIEYLSFHFSMKRPLPEWTIESIIKKIDLWEARNKQIRQFSSGMKQRAKLGQAFFTDAPILLLDEPTANFDVQGISLYLQLIREFTDGRLVIICSNDEKEIEFCNHRINLSAYKI